MASCAFVFHEVFAATVIVLPVSIILATFNVPVIVPPVVCTAELAALKAACASTLAELALLNDACAKAPPEEEFA